MPTTHFHPRSNAVPLAFATSSSIGCISRVVAIVAWRWCPRIGVSPGWATMGRRTSRIRRRRAVGAGSWWGRAATAVVGVTALLVVVTAWFLAAVIVAAGSIVVLAWAVRQGLTRPFPAVVPVVPIVRVTRIATAGRGSTAVVRWRAATRGRRASRRRVGTGVGVRTAMVAARRVGVWAATTRRGPTVVACARRWRRPAVGDSGRWARLRRVA
mmetsp:Transcript_36022/g.92798  ORF Transcript_36022/g.92798 Transcript_36022/m.92798 type:complete len:213 (-) Transcript_36022:827-1465(-)